MKEYIRQFYNEGLATTFYLKPMNFFKKHIKNKTIVKILGIIIKLLYTVLAIAFMVYMFISKI